MVRATYHSRPASANASLEPGIPVLKSGLGVLLGVLEGARGDACFAQTAQALDQQGGSGHGIGAVNQVVEEFVILLGRDLE